MRIHEVTLQEIRMKLVAPFETSMERTEARRILLVQANVDGVTGWAECVAGESPYYSPEMIDTAWFIFRDFLWPLIKGKEFATANDVWDLLARVRGHNMAKAALEAAVWDAEAQQKSIPLAKLIGGVREEIACGVSVGIKESLDELAAEVQKELAAGFSAHQADGRRQLLLHPAGLAAPQATRRLLPDDDRAAARLGRSLQPRRAAEKAGHADLPGRVHPLGRTGARRH